MAETGVKYRNIGLLSSDFVETMKKGYFVDKSLLIKDIIDSGSEVTLITRPRRFGKSLNLSMIQTFFEKTEDDNSVYFKNLKIWERGEKYWSEQGKYPVICMSFKDPKGKSWEKLYSDIKTEIVREYARHPELDGNVEKLLRPMYDRIVNGTGSESDYNESLRLLSDLLYKYHKVKPVVLLDEYDHPIQEAVDGGYYDDAIDFFKPFLSKALKDNKSLSFAVVMGITRVSKEGIFSGLNNLKVCSVLKDRYSQYFGFTEDEVDRILADYDCSKKKKEVREWYNGYRFGKSKTRIYNPWSLVNYVSTGCEAEKYWVQASENEIIGNMLDSASEEVVKNLYVLLNGGSIEAAIDEDITYRELYEDPDNIYSMLLMSGYLKYVSKNGENYVLTIPNREVGKIYNREVINKIGGNKGNSSANNVANAIKAKDAEGFRAALEHYITTSVNYEVLKNEYAYEDIAIGVFAALDNVYYILPEDRLPSARSDQVLVPKDKYKNRLPAVVIEYERCEDEKDLEAMALAGRRQIDEKEYDAKLKALGYTDIFKMGVAFCGSHVVVKTESEEKSPE